VCPLIYFVVNAEWDLSCNGTRTAIIFNPTISYFFFVIPDLTDREYEGRALFFELSAPASIEVLYIKTLNHREPVNISLVGASRSFLMEIIFPVIHMQLQSGFKSKTQAASLNINSRTVSLTIAFIH
jgi:hypothetical protein